jgi:hypothetical protein
MIHTHIHRNPLSSPHGKKGETLKLGRHKKRNRIDSSEQVMVSLSLRFRRRFLYGGIVVCVILITYAHIYTYYTHGQRKNKREGG